MTTGVEMLDVLCPMHLVVRPDGRISHVGPTLQKLRPKGAWLGTMFFDHFTVKRPKMVKTITDMSRIAGTKLHLELRENAACTFKAVLARETATGIETTAQNYVINLSFGISILDGVRAYRLSNKDFAPTDLAVEMLYLIEAKSAAMSASRKLNLKLQVAKIAAEEQAFTDTLTGLKNRRAMDLVLGRMISRKAAFAIMQIDLDYFKSVNDTLGHAAGDHVLQAAAQIMLDETRRGDTISRVGGDEFILLMPDIETEQGLMQIGERLVSRLRRPILFQDRECKVSASIGTIWVRENHNITAKGVLAQVDAALYHSKNAGRSRQTLVGGRRRQGFWQS